MSVRIWFSQLSRIQKIWLYGTLAAMIGVVVAGIAVEFLGPGGKEAPEVNTGMSILEVAPRLDITGMALARELGLPLTIPKREPLGSLGVTEKQLDEAAAHAMSHRSGPLKYFVFAALVLGATVYLVRLGRPDGSATKDRKAWYPRAVYVAFLLTAVVVAGFLLGKSPNPMEGAVKVFKAMVGLYPDTFAKVAALAFFLILAVVGNKVICGWGCPFGALQELIYSLPVMNRLKRKKLPFAVTNTIRAVLFVTMLLVLFGVVGGRRGMVLYHFVNPFNLFDLRFETVSILVTVVVLLSAAFFVYRPFCQLICPFGFVSWIAERLSVWRVRIDRDACTACGACTRVCPLEAAKGRVDRKRFPADCFSCARCLNVCPVDALEYSARGKEGREVKEEAASGSETHDV